LIAREIREERQRDLDTVLSQIAHGRMTQLSAPPLSLEAQFQISVGKMREDVQRAKDVQSTHILRWLRS
jgi:hypothetical protein